MDTEIVFSDTRRRVLQYFETQIHRTGLGAFTVDQMSRELKISKRTIYQEFPNKAAIVSAFVDTVKGRLDEHFHAIDALDLRPAQRLILAFKGVLDILTPFLNQTISDLKQLYPDIWHGLVQFRMEKFNHLFNLLHQAQGDGDLNPNLNLDRLAYLLPRVMDELFQPEIVFHPDHASRDMVKEVFLILFQGIFAGKIRDSFLQLFNENE
ncbi:MAG: TetR/AcrR family transcriptional regulator [Lentisphaeria bacterium]|nr:TetR/AcrR family transcriptional regulator [Candidatus Neomarinimicrobiota bacterium]MCF7841517.1 TetR/AcrR family transcriptional regulator [Lentisphaeria bacterium]